MAIGPKEQEQVNDHDMDAVESLISLLDEGLEQTSCGEGKTCEVTLTSYDVKHKLADRKHIRLEALVTAYIKAGWLTVELLEPNPANPSSVGFLFTKE